LTNDRRKRRYRLSDELSSPSTTGPTSRYVLEGRAMTTDEDLFIEFSRALSFPAYFGHNWDALEESLSTPEDWNADSCPRRRLEFNDAHEILKSSLMMNTFVSILMDAPDRLRFVHADAVFCFQFTFPTTSVAERSPLWKSVSEYGGILRPDVDPA
jgi:hypothetical protein